MAEILNTNGVLVSKTVSEFDFYDIIRYSAANPTAAVALKITDAGYLDLSDELGSVAATVTAAAAGNQIISGAGNDTLNGGIGNDTLDGGAGGDTIDGGGGDDDVTGGLGDTLKGGTGTDFLDLDLGTTTAALTLSVKTQLTQAVTVATGTTITGFERFNLIFGTGNDRLDLRGATLDTNYNSYFYDAGGIETLQVDAASQGYNQLFNFEKLSVDLTGLTTGAYITGSYISFSGFSAYNNDYSTSAQLNFTQMTVTGGSGDDSVTGGAGADTFKGGEGADTLDGGAGADTLKGEGGDDTVNGNIGDTLDGGTGTDYLGLDLGTTTAALTFVAKTQLTQAVTVATGTTITGFERFNFTFGTGNDTLDLRGATLDTNYNSYFYDAGGTDTLQVDAASQGYNQLFNFEKLSVDLTGLTTAAYITGSYISFSGFSAYNNDYNTSAQLNFTQKIITGGSGDDSVYGNIGDTLKGGAGNDFLDLDLGATAAALTLAVKTQLTQAVTVATGTTISGFERFDLTFGTGGDTLDLRGASLDPNAYSTFYDAGGTDTLQVDAASQGYVQVENFEKLSVDLTGLTTGATIGRYYVSFDGFYAYNYVEGTGNYLDFTQKTVTGGSGDDYVYGNIGDTLKGGAGSDFLDLDLGATTAGATLTVAGQSTVAANTTVSGFERFNLTFGTGADTLDLRGASLYSSSTFFDAGGTDTLQIDAASQGSASVYNFEKLSVDLTGLTTGVSINRSSVSFAGFFAGNFNPSIGDSKNFTQVDAKAGSAVDDYIELDLSATGTGVTLTAAGSSTLPIGTISGFERFYLTFGTGDDTVDLRGAQLYLTSTFVDTGGTDTLQINAASQGYANVYGFEKLSVDLTGLATDAYITAHTVSFDNFYAASINESNGAYLDFTQMNVKGGSGNDSVTGSAGADTFEGGAGDDTLDGGAAFDRAIYSGLFSSYTVTGNLASATVSGPDGTDTLSNIESAVFSNGTYNFVSGVFTPTSTGVTITGTAGVDTISTTVSPAGQPKATAFGDTIYGLGGDDSIDGGGGGDVMYGGVGNDTYFVDNTGDQVNEANPVSGANDGGTDLVYSSVNFALGAFMEYLILTGNQGLTGTGNDLANVLKGNDAANTLSGLGGDDILAGYGGSDTLLGGTNNDILDGGTGDDVMRGGAGNDFYLVDSTGDQASDANTSGGDEGGADLVYASASFALGSFIETLILTGSGAIDGAGNASANVIKGNGASNTLSGQGGNDTLFGNGGVDTLRGGADNDRLEGGAGNDFLHGGSGNDTYIVESGADQVSETDAFGADEGGTDFVYSSASFTLGAFLERLVLTGAGAINGTGNDANNVLAGNNAANTLRGAGGIDLLQGGGGADKLYGGQGIDVLYGGTEADSFVFDTALNGGTNVDKLMDFVRGSDRIDLDDAIFAGLTAQDAQGHLTASQFRLGQAAVQSTDRIVYDQSAGKLFYDVDGLGGQKQVLFAALTPNQALTASDLFVA